MLEREWRKGMLLHCWWECKLIQPLWKMVWRFLKKTGMKPPYDPAIPFLVIHPEETKIEKRHMYLIVHCSTIYDSQNMGATQICPSTDEGIKKLWYIYTMEYYSTIKKSAFESVLMRWINIEPIIQNEVSQKEKDKYRILMHIYRIQKNGTEEFICRAAMQKKTQRTDLQTWGEGRSR